MIEERISTRRERRRAASRSECRAAAGRRRFQPLGALRRRRALVAALVAASVALGAASPIHAQTLRAAIIPPEVVPAEVASFAPIVEDAIAVDLERRGYVIGERGTDGALIAVEYRLHPVLPRLHLSIVVRDPARNLVIAAVATQARANVTLYASVSELMDEALTAVDGYRMTAVAVDAMVAPVSLPPPLPPVAPPRDLANGRPWGVQLHTSLGRLAGVGAGVRYRALRGRVGARAEIDTYASGVGTGAPHLPAHLETRLIAGFVPLAFWRDRIQIGVETGVGGILTTLVGREVQPYWDTYWNVVSVSVNVQVNRFSWFARVGPVYGFETERGFLTEGMSNEGSNPLLTTGVVWWL